MKRAVRFAPQAFAQVQAAQRWWVQNRPGAPRLFRDEPQKQSVSWVRRQKRARPILIAASETCTVSFSTARAIPCTTATNPPGSRFLRCGARSEVVHPCSVEPSAERSVWTSRCRGDIEVPYVGEVHNAHAARNFGGRQRGGWGKLMAWV